MPQRVTRERQAQLRLSATQVDELVKTYEAGASATEAAKRFGVCPQTALNHLASRGVEVRPTQKIPDSALAEVRRMRDAGWSYARIGQEYSCSGTAVYQRLKGRRES